ncbi:MAG: S9 family peptidase, partial [Alphaproteobacteria bacterium]|nr:S9 family peptidase [Alphaproteobacteria bacterium]
MRIRILRLGLAAALGVGAGAAGNSMQDNDPYLWLSDIQGAKPLVWVQAQNARTDAALKSDPGYRKDYNWLLSILNADDRIPLPQAVDRQWVFSFWQDASHPRGLWRRTTVEDYARSRPNWQLLFDVDKYDRETGKNWVWQGADCTPSFNRCLVSLSAGGTDAHEVHEFDPAAGTFADGFSLPAAKSQARYLDDGSVLFASDFGSG